MDASLSFVSPRPVAVRFSGKIGLVLLVSCAAAALFRGFSLGAMPPDALTLSLFFGLLAGLWLFLRDENWRRTPGAAADAVWLRGLTSRGIWGFALGVLLTEFYVCLYWAPQFLQPVFGIFEPLSRALSGQAADQWFVYGTVYTAAVLAMGARFIGKHRGNRYQIFRTCSVMFFQLGFAYLIPAFMKMMHQPEYYFTYFWPLKDWYGSPSGISFFLSKGSFGVFLVVFGLGMTFVGTPILTYFFGKRWYCSWVCGCGGLAETVGDPFRHLSDKSLSAWKLERWMIHAVLLAVAAMTGLLWANSYWQGGLLGEFSAMFSKTYGFLIGSMFSGVIGVGFYPLMGSRVWCRFGCPMAAYLGILQKRKSRFRITVNGGQCISCGNCSNFCEMGIDVRHYAQRGQDVVRASCVGCGICATVCPRGVLRLENLRDDTGARRAERQRVGFVPMEEVKILG